MFLGLGTGSKVRAEEKEKADCFKVVSSDSDLAMNVIKQQKKVWPILRKPHGLVLWSLLAASLGHYRASRLSV